MDHVTKEPYPSKVNIFELLDFLECLVCVLLKLDPTALRRFTATCKKMLKMNFAEIVIKHNRDHRYPSSKHQILAQLDLLKNRPSFLYACTEFCCFEGKAYSIFPGRTAMMFYENRVTTPFNFNWSIASFSSNPVYKIHKCAISGPSNCSGVLISDMEGNHFVLVFKHPSESHLDVPIYVRECRYHPEITHEKILSLEISGKSYLVLQSFTSENGPCEGLIFYWSIDESMNETGCRMVHVDSPILDIFVVKNHMAVFSTKGNIKFIGIDDANDLYPIPSFKTAQGTIKVIPTGESCLISLIQCRDESFNLQVIDTITHSTGFAKKITEVSKHPPVVKYLRFERSPFDRQVMAVSRKTAYILLHRDMELHPFRKIALDIEAPIKDIAMTSQVNPDGTMEIKYFLSDTRDGFFLISCSEMMDK